MKAGETKLQRTNLNQAILKLFKNSLGNCANSQTLEYFRRTFGSPTFVIQLIFLREECY